MRRPSIRRKIIELKARRAAVKEIIIERYTREQLEDVLRDIDEELEALRAELKTASR